MDGDVVERGVILTPPAPKGGSGQNSRGSSLCSSPLSPVNSDDKVQSRYLGPSMASCHDFCKYGRKHAYEDGNRPNFREFLRKKPIEDGDQVQALSLELDERKKKPVIKQESTKHTRKSTVSSETGKSISSGENKKSSSSGKNKVPWTSRGNDCNQVKSLRLNNQKKGKMITPRSPLQSEFPPDQPNVIEANSLSDEPSVIEPKSPHNEPNVIEPKSPPDEPSVIEPESPSKPTVIEPIDIASASEIDASRDPNIKKENEKSPVMNSTTSVSAKAVKQKASPSVKKPMASAKPQYGKQKAPPPLKIVDVISKPAIILKAKTPLIRSLSQRKSSGSLISRRNQENKLFRSLGISKFGERKVWKPKKSSETPHDGISSLKTMTPPTSSISQLKSSQRLSSRRNQENKLLKSLGTTEVGEKKVLRPTVSSETPCGDGISSLKTVTPMRRSISQLKSSWSLVARRNQENKMVRSLGTGTSKVEEKKVLKPTMSSKTPRGGVSSLNSIILRNIKRSFSVKNKDKDIELNPNQRTEKSMSSTNEVNNEGIEGKREAEVSKGKVKRGPRSASTSHSEDSKPTPYKLKFKNGKVIELRSESIGARRLWLGIGRLAGENSKGNGAGRKSFRRKRDVSSQDSNGPNSEVQSVVLKHQDVKQKKDAQALYNHVIEETASKLVESRKSKVKALVGAFETVISLQESKPASAV